MLPTLLQATEPQATEALTPETASSLPPPQLPLQLEGLEVAMRLVGLNATRLHRAGLDPWPD